MKPVKFKSANAVLGPPEEWDSGIHGECSRLHVLKDNSYIYSCWKPSFGERVKLLFGQPVKLIVAWPMTMPPVALEVGEP